MTMNVAADVQTACRRVLFLCTGNYYRSRFAEILFNHEARRRGLAWRAESRGLDPDPRNSGPISRFTLDWLAKLGICCPTINRMPRVAAADDFSDADLVIAVKQAEHEPLIAANFHQWLAGVEYWSVHDLDCAGPDEAIPALYSHVHGLLDRLAREAD
jgi:protein-tyrosine phosphatase